MKYKCNKAKGKQIFIAEDLENQSVPDPPPPHCKFNFLNFTFTIKSPKKKKVFLRPHWETQINIGTPRKDFLDLCIINL